MFAPLCVCMLVSACVSECTFALLVDARAGVRNPVRARIRVYLCVSVMQLLVSHSSLSLFSMLQRRQFSRHDV